MVAYSFYKRQKIEWIKTFTEDSGREPTPEEMAHFLRLSNMPSQVESYKEQAVSLIDAFLEATLAEKAEDVATNMRDDAIVKAVNRGFWRNVLESGVSGLVSSLLTFGIVGALWVASKGPESLLREILRDYVQQETTLNQAPGSDSKTEPGALNAPWGETRKDSSLGEKKGNAP